MNTIEQHVNEQFYRWELRGRGWQVFDAPVAPEPPFRPFSSYYLSPQRAIDDARRPTALSSFVERLSRKLGAQPKIEQPIQEEEPDPAPQFALSRDLAELQLLVPNEFESSWESFEQFLVSLSGCRAPISFELLGTPGQIKTLFVADSGDASILRRQLQTFFPESACLDGRDILDKAWSDGGEAETVIVEFGLGREFMRTLACRLRHDPFVAITGALSELHEGEFGAVQVIFAPSRHPWAENIVRSVIGADGAPIFDNAADLPREANEKTSRPLFAAVVRLAAKSWNYYRAWEIARNIAGALRGFARPLGNELIPLRNDQYLEEAHEEDFLRRQSRRSGMILNSAELAGFVHLPNAEVKAPNLRRLTGKTKEAPDIVQKAMGVSLGTNDHLGDVVDVRLSPEARVRHMHLIGASGTGKSTLLFNLIRQDIENGDGLAVLDPHGDLIDRIVSIIPESRTKDVILLDPSDEEYSIGFNILSAHSDLEKNLLASDLVSVFKRLSTSWGDQMESVLNNAIRAFLESSRGGTLADLRRFLLDAEFRGDFLATVQDPEMDYYWRKAFPQLGGNKSIGPVLTRLESFLSPKPIRYMVSQTENRLDFGTILDSGKIFLARLSHGSIGKENAYLLGTLLVSKFQQLAMARQSRQESERRYFWLYIDEFQNFVTPSMAEIVTGARKYRLGLILAHQELRQLQRDSEVASAVLSNAYTRICFRVGDQDARFLEGGFASFDVRKLQNLGTGEAICRVERSQYDFNLRVPFPQALPECTAERRNAIIAESRARYARPRAEIERALLRSAEPAEKSTKSQATAEPQGKQAQVRQEEEQPEKPPAAKSKPSEPAESKDMPVAEADQTAEHEAIKNRIKTEAESLDYTAKLEQFVLDGRGRVDVALRRGERSIACEISVTTTIEHEVGNVKKCLEAGYIHVAVICLSKKRLAHIRDAVNRAIPAVSERVGYYLPNEFVIQLSEWAMGDPAGGVVEKSKPRKRKITLDCGELSAEDRHQRENEMIQRLAQSMKRPPSA